MNNKYVISIGEDHHDVPERVFDYEEEAIAYCVDMAAPETIHWIKAVPVNTRWDVVLKEEHLKTLGFKQSEENKNQYTMHIRDMFFLYDFSTEFIIIETSQWKRDYLVRNLVLFIKLMRDAGVLFDEIFEGIKPYNNTIYGWTR